METKIVFSQIKQDFNLLKQIFELLEEEEREANCVRLFVSGKNFEAYFDDKVLITAGFHSVGEKFIFSDIGKEKYEKEFPHYSDEMITKMASELSGKTKLLKKLKKKLRKSYTLGRLQKILEVKKQFKQDPWAYQNIDSFDDQGYRRDSDKNEAEVQLLEDLIDSKKKKRWMHY